MKYEDADILAFVSDKSKKGSVPQINSGAERNSGAEGNTGTEGNSGIEGSSGFKKIPEIQLNPEIQITEKVANSLEGALNQATMLTPESSSFIPDTSMKSHAVRLPERDDLPFEAFAGYYDGVLKASLSSWARGQA